MVRIEDVSGRPGRERTRWTSVLGADSGRLLRLDYRCVAATRPVSYEWQQELAGTGFEKHLSRQAFRITIEPVNPSVSLVSLTAIHTLRGTARLAGMAMKKSQRRLLDEALEALGALLEPAPAGEEKDGSTS